MRTRKHGIATAMLAATALVLTACQGGAPGGGNSEEIRERKLVFALITPESFPYFDGAEKFKQVVEEKTDGKITVDVFAGGQLGQERDINESILDGSIHVGVGAGALATLAPVMNLLELPFLIQDQAHMQRIVDSPAADQLAERIRNEGKFHVLDWFSTGDSSIQTVDVPISEPSDLNGLKLRSIENPALTDALRALGANPTPMPYGEVYTGIQTGVIEGATLDWGSVNSLKLFELIKHATAPEAAFLAEPRPVIVSADFWDTLNQAEQEAISEAMTEAATYERQFFVDLQEDAIAAVKGAGVQVSEINEQAFLEILEPVWNKWAADLDAEEMLNTIRDLRE
ncbi:TRAP transporter substrate-binding protein [Arthrobacter sp.]|uniref:TRAP transporter substrate-binding protein n=1 Tax=Arthrobacter sp. TaxID=1667 RepID=UPI0028114DA1|nr:TRAP transporter substrate-binding protein [Arthrobacter sp.]